MSMEEEDQDLMDEPEEEPVKKPRTAKKAKKKVEPEEVKTEEKKE